MLTLFADLAHHEGCFAVVHDDRVLSFVPVDHRIGDDKVMPLFKKAFEDAHLNYGDVTHVACVVGPGGFTSLRMATALVNAFTWEKKIPSAAVHGSDVWKARSMVEDVLWLHSTKKEEVFIRGFGKYAALWREPTHMKLGDVVGLIPKDAQWVGELISEHEEKIHLPKATLSPLQEVLPAFLQTLNYEQKILEPWYGRGW